MLQFCWQWSQNNRLVNTIQIQNSLLCVVFFGIYIYIYNEYSAKLQKAISGRGKNMMASFEDK